MLSRRDASFFFKICLCWNWKHDSLLLPINEGVTAALKLYSVILELREHIKRKMKESVWVESLLNPIISSSRYWPQPLIPWMRNCIKSTQKSVSLFVKSLVWPSLYVRSHFYLECKMLMYKQDFVTSQLVGKPDMVQCLKTWNLQRPETENEFQPRHFIFMFTDSGAFLCCIFIWSS